MRIDLQEDNEACLQIMRTGRNPSMKHVSRTHGVNIAWLHAQFAKHFVGINCHTLLMCADIFTKPFGEKAKWHAARKLIAHFTKEEFRVFVPPPVPPSKGRGGKSSTKEDSENDENEAYNESSGSVGSASSAGSRTRPPTKSKWRQRC